MREEAYKRCFTKSLSSGDVTGEFCADCKNFAPIFGYTFNSEERFEVAEGHPTPFSPHPSNAWCIITAFPSVDTEGS